MDSLAYIILGLVAGAMAGLLGIGGGLVMIPALVFLFGYTQQEAQGTSLAVMIPPVGLLAALQYYKQGFVNVRAAAIIALCFVIGTVITSTYISNIPELTLKRVFGVLMCFVAGQMLFSGGIHLGSVPWLAGGAGALLAGGALKSRKDGKAKNEDKEQS